MGYKEKIKIKVNGKEKEFSRKDLFDNFMEDKYKEISELYKTISKNAAIMGTAKWVVPTNMIQKRNGIQYHNSQKKFKVGDKVRITKVSTLRPWLVGEVGVVTNTDYENADSNKTNFPLQIKLENTHSHTSGYIWLHKDDEWEEFLQEFNKIVDDTDDFDFSNFYFDDYAENKDTELYCDCWEPDIVKSMACGEEFDFCRKCKKEKL